jgi:hypothetical protein
MEPQTITENTISPDLTLGALPKQKKLNITSILLMVNEGITDASSRARNFSRNIFGGFNFNNRRGNKFILPLIFAVLVIGILGAFLFFGRTVVSRVSEIDTKPAPSVAKLKTTINREFDFPIRNSKGEKVSNLKYKIENAELYDSLIVKGQRAKAVKGRQFLIINLKLDNEFSQSIQIKTADYIRLVVNNKNEQLAPDIHNDPVEVQPISTKYTRVGFPINETDKDLVIKVGEISGDKTDIRINF